MPTGSTIQASFLSSGGAISTLGKVLQRKAKVQLRPGMEAFPVELRPRSGGLPLPRDVQAKMESALGATFSEVRIHVGSDAPSIGALAFTWGSDIHFAPGQYNPHTPQGQFLLGHELTHVIQQRAGRVPNPFGSGVAVVQDGALEAEADRMGRMAAAFSPQKAAPSAVAPNGTGRGVSSVINQKPATAPAYAMRPAVREGSGWQIAVTAMGQASPVGSVRLTPRENGVFLSDLSVAPAHRRHGLATQLVQAAMQTARSQGYNSAHLEARPSVGSEVTPGSLISMYQKLGFRMTGLSARGNPVLERTT